MLLKQVSILIVLYSLETVTSWTFESTMEAYTAYVHNPGICLGNCIYSVCTYDWHAHETECIKTSISTKKYRTLDNELCTSNCGNFDGKSYQWCAIGTNYWGYCSRLIARTATESYRTHSEYISCSDECATRGYNYYWCHAVVGKWQHCYPEKKILVFNYRTKDYKECKTPCEIYKKKDLPYCYDSSGTWQQCFLNPAYQNTINEIDENLRRFCKPGGFFEEGYRLCHLKTKRTITEFDLTCTLDVDAVASRHEDNNPTVSARPWSSLHPITNDANPIYSYTVFPVTRAFGENQLNLPLVVRAVITTNTLLPVGARRPGFTSEVTRYYRDMDIITGTSNNDERGHIIASRLGGPMETYNIFPQSWRHNRGSGSKWFRMEANLDTFIRGHDDRHAEFTAVLSYSTDPNNNIVTRPTAVGVRIRLYIGGVLSDFDGNRLSSTTENPYENMYFSNDPDVPCD
uniref:Type VII secretion system protein EssD-like domain-containing protein n=1 Tax=Heliothis virescens TaxID=7102 RepID=A0A2A4JHT9_HELVI